MSAEYLDALRAIAEAHERAEAAFRRESQQRLDALAAERARAYRRYHLVQEMVEGAAPVAEHTACVAVQISRVLTEAGWSESDAAYAEVAERLGTVALLIHADLHGAVDPTAEAASSVLQALETFEAWYRARFGTEFPALRPHEASAFQSLVDF